MVKLWGFLRAIFGVIPEKLGCDNPLFEYYGSTILEKLGCHAVKAGMPCRKSWDAILQKSCELVHKIDKSRWKKWLCQYSDKMPNHKAKLCQIIKCHWSCKKANLRL